MAFMAAAAGASAISGILSAQGQQAAAKTEANAAQQSSQMLQQAGQQAEGNFQPYLQEGQQATSLLGQQLPMLTQGFNPTVAQLDATPGFQFMNQQGQQAVQSQMAQQGLIGSGAEGKALANYSSQLALSNYGQLAHIYNQNRQISLNGLMGAAGIGQTASQNYAQTALQAAGGAANYNNQAGQYLGAGIAGAANAYGQIPSNAIGAAAGAQFQQGAYGINPFANLFGGGGGSTGGAVLPPSIMNGFQLS